MSARKPTPAQLNALRFLSNGHEIVFDGGWSPSVLWTRPGSKVTFQGLRVDTFLALTNRGWIDEQDRSGRFHINDAGRAALAKAAGEQR